MISLLGRGGGTIQAQFGLLNGLFGFPGLFRIAELCGAFIALLVHIKKTYSQSYTDLGMPVFRWIIDWPRSA